MTQTNHSVRVPVELIKQVKPYIVKAKKYANKDRQNRPATVVKDTLEQFIALSEELKKLKKEHHELRIIHGVLCRTHEEHLKELAEKLSK